MIEASGDRTARLSGEPIDSILLDQLYGSSRAAEFGLSRSEFAGVLEEVRKRYAPAATPRETAIFLESLRLEDLALARACANGNERAWEIFLTRFRAKLYQAGAAIAKNESDGRDLADALYPELFGTRVDGAGRRVSKLNSYSGRGSLDGWLRTVLAQEYVNRYRAARHTVSFEEREAAGQQFPATAPQTDGPASDGRAQAALEEVTDAALRELAGEERLILVSYYLDGATLAAIGRMLGVHESTVSRKLERIASDLRKRILKGLKAKGLRTREAEEALDADVRDLRVNVRLLVQEKGG
jgi:RNA polymerase sigma-70 factor (ECF subfamily)